MSTFERFPPNILCFPQDVAKACTSSEISSIRFPCFTRLASSTFMKRPSDAPHNAAGKIDSFDIRCRYFSLECKKGSVCKELGGMKSITARGKTEAALDEGRAHSHDRFRMTEFARNAQCSSRKAPSFGTSTITCAAPDNNFSEFQVVEAAVQSSDRSSMLIVSAKTEQEERQVIDRLINATILGAAGLYALTKIFTVDQDYWHGWTVFEILKYAPIHNWTAYEEALKSHPVLAKMMISGIVYSVGDVMAQCYEGKQMLEFSRVRMLRSGLVGFCLHGSLSHFYYHFCEAILPFRDWWAVPLKVAFDQTVWSAFWNSIYYITVGLLRFESPLTILSELRATFLPLLMAGWKLWPFAHVVTYGFVPVEQRLLWVDTVELVWVTILSMYSNEKAEARTLDVVSDDAADLVSANNIDNTDEVQT